MKSTQFGCKIREISQYFLLFSVFILLLSCQTMPKEPQWYNALPSTDGILIGYGQGKSQVEARQMAFSAIAQQFEVQIESEMAMVKQFGEDQLKTSAREVTQIKVNQDLKNVSTLRESHSGDAYYVALQVDERPIKLVIEGKLRDKGYRNPAFNGPEVISKSPLLTSLQSGSQENMLDVSLQRSSEQWQIAIADVLQPVTDLSEVLNWNHTPAKSLHLSVIDKQENRIQAGQTFRLKLEMPELDQGYLSLFNIYSDGRLTIALDNQPISEAAMTFPDHPLWLKASPLIPGQPDRDTYLAIVTEQNVDTTQFRKTGDQVVKGEEAYVLHKFINWLETQPILEMSALNIEIYP